MLDAIKTRLISWLLSNTVARWVVVDEKNVKVAGKGLQAEQLQVCTDCLDGLGLPITVAAGHVGKVSVEWVSKTVFRIIVEEADVHVRPRISDDDWANNCDLEQDGQVRGLTRARLEQWEDELQKRRERSAGGKDVKEAEDKPASDKDKPEEGKESKEGMFEGLKRTLLRNIHVEIRGLHVRYSDPINGFEVGLKLEHASLLNVHSTKSTRLVGRQQGKALEVRGVSLYTQYRQMEPTRAAPPSPAPPQSSSPTPSLPPYGGAAASTEPLYLLQPIGAHATLYYGLGSELTVEVPLAAVELDRVQYAAVARATETVTNHRQGRPLQGAGESSSVRRAWWVYAIGRTLQALRRRRYQRSAAFLAQRAVTKARYVQLYLAARVSPLDAKQSAEMLEVEDATTLEEIICFRRIALRQAPPPKEGAKPDKAALAQAGGGRRWWSRVRAASQRVTGRGGGGAGEAWSETDLQEIMDALGAGEMGADEGDDELTAAEEAGGGSHATKAAGGNGGGTKGPMRITRFISVQVQEGRVALLSPHRLPEAKLVFRGTDVTVELTGMQMAVEACLSTLSLCAADGTAVVKSVDHELPTPRPSLDGEDGVVEGCAEEAQADERTAGKVPTWESVRKKAAWALKSSRTAAADDAAVQRPRLLHVRMVSNWTTLPAVLSVDVQTQSLEVRLTPGFLPRIVSFFQSASISLWRTRRAVATKAAGARQSLGQLLGGVGVVRVSACLVEPVLLVPYRARRGMDSVGSIIPAAPADLRSLAAVCEEGDELADDTAVEAAAAAATTTGVGEGLGGAGRDSFAADVDAVEAARQGSALVALRVGCLRIGTDGDEGGDGEGAQAHAGEEGEEPGKSAAPVNQFQVEVTGLGIDLLDASAGDGGPTAHRTIDAHVACLANDIGIAAQVNATLPLRREGGRSEPDLEVMAEVGGGELVATLDHTAQVVHLLSSWLTSSRAPLLTEAQVGSHCQLAGQVVVRRQRRTDWAWRWMALRDQRLYCLTDKWAHRAEETWDLAACEVTEDTVLLHAPSASTSTSTAAAAAGGASDAIAGAPGDVKGEVGATHVRVIKLCVAGAGEGRVGQELCLCLGEVAHKEWLQQLREAHQAASDEASMASSLGSALQPTLPADMLHQLDDDLEEYFSMSEPEEEGTEAIMRQGLHVRGRLRVDATLVRLCLPCAAARIKQEKMPLAGGAHQLLTLDIRGLEVWYEAPAQHAAVALEAGASLQSVHLQRCAVGGEAAFPDGCKLPQWPVVDSASPQQLLSLYPKDNKTDPGRSVDDAVADGKPIADDGPAVRAVLERGWEGADPEVQVHVGAIWAKVNPVGQALLGAVAAYLAEAWTGHLPTEALRFLERQLLQEEFYASLATLRDGGPMLKLCDAPSLRDLAAMAAASAGCVVGAAVAFRIGVEELRVWMHDEQGRPIARLDAQQFDCRLQARLNATLHVAGEMGVVELQDISPANRLYPTILTGTPGTAMVSFAVQSFSPLDLGFPDHHLHVGVHVQRAEGVLLMRVLMEMLRPRFSPACIQDNLPVMSLAVLRGRMGLAAPTKGGSKPKGLPRTGPTIRVDAAPPRVKMIEVTAAEATVSLPRSSLSHDGAVLTVRNFSLRNQLLGDSEPPLQLWRCSFADGRLAARQSEPSSGKVTEVPLTDTFNLELTIQMLWNAPPAGSMEALTPAALQVATHTPRFWMDFDFDRVRLALSDGQLKLVCGMIRENFMERAVHGLLPPLKQEGFDKKDDVMDQFYAVLNHVLSSNLDKGAKPSAKRDKAAPVSQRYTVSIGQLTLETSLAAALTDPDPEPVAHLGATGLSVDFVQLISGDLAWEAVAEVAHTLEITPARRSSERELAAGAPPVTTEGPPAVSFCDKRRTEATVSTSTTIPAAAAAVTAEELPLFWLDFCRLTNGNHSQLEISLLSPDVCAEWGLLQAILEWVKEGTATEPPPRRFPDSDDVVVTYGLKDIAAPVQGGFICRVALAPDCRIHLLPSDLWAASERSPGGSAAEFPCPVSEGLQADGRVLVLYASMNTRRFLKVDAQQLRVSRRAAGPLLRAAPGGGGDGQGRGTSELKEVLAPCGILFTWKWAVIPPGVTDDVDDAIAGGGSQKNLFITSLLLTVSYEDVILAMRCIQYFRHQHRPTRVAPASATPAPMLRSASEGALEDAEDAEAGIALEAAAAASTGKGGQQEPQHTFAMTTEGVTLVLIDDFQGRFMPLLRVALRRTTMQATTTAWCKSSTGELVLSMDSFDPTRGRWEKALERVGVDLQSKRNEGVGPGALRSQSVSIEAGDAVLNVTQPCLSALCSAYRTWGTDRRLAPLLHAWRQRKVPPKAAAAGSGAGSAAAPFHPYLVQNWLAEPLVAVVQRPGGGDGSACVVRVGACAEAAVDYEQLWSGQAQDARTMTMEGEGIGSHTRAAVHVEGWCAIAGVDLDQTGMHTHHLTPSGGVGSGAGLATAAVVTELIISRGQKVLQVRPSLLLVNHSAVELEMGVMNTPGANEPDVDLGVVSSGETVPVPLSVGFSGWLRMRGTANTAATVAAAASTSSSSASATSALTAATASMQLGDGDGGGDDDVVEPADKMWSTGIHLSNLHQYTGKAPRMLTVSRRAPGADDLSSKYRWAISVADSDEPPSLPLRDTETVMCPAGARSSRVPWELSVWDSSRVGGVFDTGGLGSSSNSGGTGGTAGAAGGVTSRFRRVSSSGSVSSASGGGGGGGSGGGLGTGRVTRQGTGAPPCVLRVAPTMVLDNALLLPVQFEAVCMPPPPAALKSGSQVPGGEMHPRKPVSELGTAAAGASVPLATADVQSEIILRLRLPDTQWSDFTQVHSGCGQPGAAQSVIALKDDLGRTLHVQVKLEMRELGTTWLHLWAAYWLVNTTSIPLEWRCVSLGLSYKDGDRSAAPARRRMAPVLMPSAARPQMLDSAEVAALEADPGGLGGHGHPRGHTRLTRTASGGTGPPRLRLQLRVKGTGNMRWSDPLPLDELLVSGARTVSCSPVMLSCGVERASAPFPREVCVVTLGPHLLIRNALTVPFAVWQMPVRPPNAPPDSPSTPRALLLEKVPSGGAIHCYGRAPAGLLRIAVGPSAPTARPAIADSAAEAASTPAEAEAEVVRAAHAGECTAALAVEEGAAPLVLLRMPGSGKLVAAEVATLPGSATRLIRFGPFVGRSPYRVANRSSHPVAVRQWNDSAVPMLVRPGETLDVVWSDPCEAPAVVVWHCGESGPAAVAVRVHMDNMERAGEMIPLADESPSSVETHVRRRNADYLLARVRPEGASRTLELNDPPNRWLRTTAGGARSNPHDTDELPELTISVSIKSLGLVATEGSGGRQQELLFVYLNGLQLVVSSGKTFRDSTLNVTGVQDGRTRKQVDSMLHNTPFPVLAVVGAPRGPYGATAPTALVLSLSQNLAASGAGTVFLRNCQIKVSPVRVFLERRILRHCQDLSQAVAVWSAPLMVELEAHTLSSNGGGGGGAVGASGGGGAGGGSGASKPMKQLKVGRRQGGGSATGAEGAFKQMHMGLPATSAMLAGGPSSGATLAAIEQACFMLDGKLHVYIERANLAPMRLEITAKLGGAAELDAAQFDTPPVNLFRALRTPSEIANQVRKLYVSSMQTQYWEIIGAFVAGGLRKAAEEFTSFFSSPSERKGDGTGLARIRRTPAASADGAARRPPDGRRR